MRWAERERESIKVMGRWQRAGEDRREERVEAGEEGEGPGYMRGAEDGTGWIKKGTIANGERVRLEVLTMKVLEPRFEGSEGARRTRIKGTTERRRGGGQSKGKVDQGDPCGEMKEGGKREKSGGESRGPTEGRGNQGDSYRK